MIFVCNNNANVPLFGRLANLTSLFRARVLEKKPLGKHISEETRTVITNSIVIPDSLIYNGRSSLKA